MASLFDPSAFIEAELSQSAATRRCTRSNVPSTPSAAEKWEFRETPAQSVATVADVAGPDAENDNSDPVGNMPWDDMLLPWAQSPCPSFIRPETFDEITNEAVSISGRWGQTAIDAGWSTIDLFGCWRRPQYRRVDCNGLVASIVGLLTPVRVTALTEAHADLTDHLGKVMRFYRRPMPFAVHLWEAYAMPTGP